MKIHAHLLILVCWFTVPSVAQPVPAVGVRYTVSWGWIGAKEDRGRTPVKLNGQEIGVPSTAFKKLGSLPIETGDRVRIVLPSPPAGQLPSEPIYSYSSFMHRWLAKGAIIEVFEGVTRLNAHTVTWKDFFVDGNYVKSMDDLTWIVDGKPIGKGDALLKTIEEWNVQKDVFVQVLIPFGWNPSSVHLGSAYRRLIFSSPESTFRTIGITPEAADHFSSQKKE